MQYIYIQILNIKYRRLSLLRGKKRASIIWLIIGIICIFTLLSLFTMHFISVNDTSHISNISIEHKNNASGIGIMGASVNVTSYTNTTNIFVNNKANKNEDH
jgi:hypothetical protein